MDLFTLEISQDWLTPIGVALVLLSVYWLRNRLHDTQSASFAVLALWLVSIGYQQARATGQAMKAHSGNGSTSESIIGQPSPTSSPACLRASMKWPGRPP